MSILFPISRAKTFLWTALLLSLFAALVLPKTAPVLLTALSGAIALLLALFLIADAMLGRWLRERAGESVTPIEFLKQQALRLLLVAGILIAAYTWFLTLRLDLDPYLVEKLWLLSGISGGVAAASLALLLGKGLLDCFSRSTAKEPRTIQEKVLQTLPELPFHEQWIRARDFQRVCAPRLAWPLIRLWLGIAVILGLIAGGAIWAAWKTFHAQETAPLIEWTSLPFLTKLCLFLAWIAVSIIIPAGILASFRLALLTSQKGRIPPKAARTQFGLAIESIGILETIVYGATMVFIILGFAVAAWQIGNWIGRDWGYAAGALLMAAAWWLLLLFPQIYVYPILTERECGWLRATEASAKLIAFEKREAFRKALAATALILSVAGIPMALALLLVKLEHLDVILTVLLGERGEIELKDSLRDLEKSRPDALKKPFELLEQGRYLDALNGFQMYLINNREDVQGLRGEALALLSMGNRRSREVLERWESLDPENDEPTRLLRQFNEGRWDEDGDLYRAAQAKCTQPIGRGI